VWLGGASTIDQVVRYARGVVLARILLKEDFGLMALVLAAMGAFEAMTEVGVRACVIQSKNATDREFLNAAWWSAALRGAFLCAVGFFSAPLVGMIYTPEIAPLLRVACFAVLLRGMMSPRTHVLEKQLRYGRVAAINQGGGALAVAATIALSLYVRNVWALVIGYVFEAGAVAVISFIVVPFLPRLKVKWEFVKEISRYARGMLGLPVFMMVFRQSPVFFLGKMVALAELGVYNFAAGLAKIPLALFNAAIMRLMLPAFSQVKNESQRFKRTVLGSVQVVSILGMPVTAFLIVFARPVLSLSYGPAYESGAPVLGILSLVTMLTMVNSNLSNVFFATARPDLYRMYALIRVIVQLALLWPGIHFMGAEGAAMAALVAFVAVFPFQMRGVKSLVPVGFGDVLRASSYGVVLGGVTLWCSMAVDALTQNAPWVDVAIGVAIFAAAVSVGLLKILRLMSRTAPQEA